MRIVVLVSGGGTNLQSLIDAQKGGKLGSGEIVGVISSKEGVYALERAQKAGIEALLVPKRDYTDIHSYSRALEAAMEHLRPSLIVQAGFLCILDSELCEKYDGKIINIHPSLIPSFCGKGMYGLHVHEAALKYGVKVTGATVHYVNAVPDGGKIIAQRATCVMESDTPESLQKRVMEECEQVLLPQVVRDLCR